jgi:tripartite-type tricarboxylate transporter receptor subunit TctC
MTNLSRRTVLAAVASAALLPNRVSAQLVTDRLARIVVGSAPGGGTDTIARLLAERLAGRYAPQVIVENRPGASSRIGAEAVKNAAPDGTAFFSARCPCWRSSRTPCRARRATIR